MAWFDLADIIGHVCITKCRKELLKAYLELNRVAGDVKKVVNETYTAVLIISDHGMKPMPDGTGDHTNYGFWSINKDIKWFKPRHATDFYHLIKKLLDI